MKLIEPSVEIWDQEEGLNGIYKNIERAGRVCYKSSDKITEDSAKPFVDRLIKSGHCYTGDSEVLTENGWKKWKDYNGEKVAAINPDRTFKGFETPSRVLKYKYSGKFYKYPELGLKVTDGHKMFGMFRDSKHNFYKENLYELFSCNTYYKDNNGREKTLGERQFKVPTNCILQKATDPFYELVGFWLGDGISSEKTSNKLIFHLKKTRKIEYLKQLCLDCGFSFEVGKDNHYKIYSPNIGRLFAFKYYRGIKIIEDNDLNPLQIHSVIQGLINSDGHIAKNTNTICFCNTSRSIIDWILTYAPLAGYNVIEGTTIENSAYPCYKVFFKTTQYIINNDSRKKNKKVIISNEELSVYCVTVSTGLILVRGTNGQTSICGNCSILEHGTIYLRQDISIEKLATQITKGNSNLELLDKYEKNPYSKVYGGRLFDEDTLSILVSTNYRVIIENNWINDLKYLCEPTEFHEKRITIHFTCDRGIWNEFIRHKTLQRGDDCEVYPIVNYDAEQNNSFAQESTRYCNFSKNKFNNEITYIIPSWLNIPEAEYGTIHDPKEIQFKKYTDSSEKEFINHLLNSEYRYFNLLKLGWTPQQARQVLPNALKTELIMTGYISDWKHFVDLRYRGTTGKPHPDAFYLAEKLYNLFKEKGIDV